MYSLHFHVTDVAFILLPLLLPRGAINIKRKRKSDDEGDILKRTFKPIKVEQQNGFVLHLEVLKFALIFIAQLFTFISVFCRK